MQTVQIKKCPFEMEYPVHTQWRCFDGVLFGFCIFVQITLFHLVVMLWCYHNIDYYLSYDFRDEIA